MRDKPRSQSGTEISEVASTTRCQAAIGEGDAPPGARAAAEPNVPRGAYPIACRPVNAEARRNARKGREGAFWEDRYHATAVDTGEHLARCVVYIDLNMVRAGVVGHPAEWEASGYHGIQAARRRYRSVDRQALAEVRTPSRKGR